MDRKFSETLKLFYILLVWSLSDLFREWYVVVYILFCYCQCCFGCHTQFSILLVVVVVGIIIIISIIVVNAFHVSIYACCSIYYFLIRRKKNVFFFIGYFYTAINTLFVPCCLNVYSVMYKCHNLREKVMLCKTLLKS